MRAFPCIPFDSHANHDLSCSPLLSSLSLSLASSGEAKGAPAVVGVGAPKIVCHSVRHSEGEGRDKGAGDLAMLEDGRTPTGQEVGWSGGAMELCSLVRAACDIPRQMTRAPRPRPTSTTANEGYFTVVKLKL